MPSASNRSQKGLIVVYNRVPKCASTTVLSYFMKHSRFLHHVTTINDCKKGLDNFFKKINYLSIPVSHEHFQYSTQEEIKLLARLYSYNFTAFIYVDHLYFYINTKHKQNARFSSMCSFFIDVHKKYGVPKDFVPSWINVIREPVQRTISRIFYIHKLQHQQHITNVQLETCLQDEAHVNEIFTENTMF